MSTVCQLIFKVSVDCQYVLLQQVSNQYSTNYLHTELAFSELTINYCQVKVNSDQEHDNNL